MNFPRCLPLACIVCLASPCLRADEPKKAAPVRIALVRSLFNDSRRAFAKPVVDAFEAMVRAQTGVDADIHRGGDAMALAAKIMNNEVDIGIFQGVEYAWARQKYPDLKPLMVIINGERERHALLVVRADAAFKDFADLKGKRVCMPKQSRLHCELFLEHGCGGKDPAQFFGEFKKPDTTEDALDDLVDGQYDAAIVDQVAFKTYERRKPGRFQKLKVLKRSVAFPPSVVAYRPGRIGAERLKQFKEGLMSADKSVLGRHLLMLWRMTAFQPVPDDLDKSLEAVLKAYPAPKEKMATGKK